MWFFFACAAALVWGISYAASGRVLQRGLSPATLFFLDVLVGLIAMASYLTIARKWPSAFGEIRALGNQGLWLAVAVIATTVGNFLIFLAIEGKNATLASLIEITYPFFVALIAWLFFREAQLTWPTAVGGALVLAGVTIIYRYA
jgi:drug/metabolite transporter (DMT)-like permease